MDPVSKLKPHKDSTIFFMSLSQGYGFVNYVTHSLSMMGSEGYCMAQRVASLELDNSQFPSPIFDMELEAISNRPLSDFDVIFQRREPPVDDEYALDCKILMTHPRVLNSPVTLQAFTEKLIPVYLGLSIPTHLRATVAPEDGVAKPMNLFGGESVRKVKRGDLLENELFQPFLPEVVNGESRYLLVGDQLFGEVLKTPAPNEFRSNSAFGAKVTLASIHPDRERISRSIIPKLNAIGVYFAAIDFIGNQIVEINITCPALYSLYNGKANPPERERLLKAFENLLRSK